MKHAIIWWLAAGASLVALLGACNDVGDCPAASAVKPGGSCSGDSLECPYTLDSPSPACDGTTAKLATSCVCTEGNWVCPSPVSCPAGDDSGSSGDDGGGSGDDASDASPAEGRAG